MSRYVPPPEGEAAFEPGSRGLVLRNRKGITRKREMDRAEYEALITAQSAFLSQVTEETRFTASLLCEMHRVWLGELYSWAGRYRTVEMSKDGFTWPPAFRVAANMEILEREGLTRHTPCPPEDTESTARRIAEVHAELLLIHPFREGNGRLSRWLADLMALQAGHPLPAYAFAGRGSRAERARYLNAVIQGYRTNYAPLTDFFAAAIVRGRRVAGEDLPGTAGRGRPRAPSKTED
jgi:cell filamentation protein